MSKRFGDEFSKVWPESKEQWSNFGKKLLFLCSNEIKPQPASLEQLIEDSYQFPLKFPINTCKLDHQPDDRKLIIENHISTVYPLIHERVLWLYAKFLEFKINYGNTKEKEIYNNMTIVGLVQRLLDKRCASFIGANDKFLLINGVKGCSGFLEIGTENEKFPLILKNCLSYDEIKLSALLSVSSYTEFLNNGTRANVGIIENDKSTIERTGVIIGIIGARLTRREVMEFQEIVIAKSQNIPDRGYGNSSEENTKEYNYRKIWNDFYGEQSILFSNVKKGDLRFGASKNKNDFFDNLMMKKRYTISFDTLLLDSESRAASCNKRGFIHVVGIGLGVWKSCPHQEEIFLETFEQRIKVLISKLKNIDFIHFSWFKLNDWGEIRDGNLIKSKEHPKGGIKVFISNRNPADKLIVPESSDTLLIVSYAWDGNALPGNEFWMGMLKSTGDSSTACSTLITELHNPHINKNMVSGSNLHIASDSYGVIHISEYAKKSLKLKST